VDVTKFGHLFGIEPPPPPPVVDTAANQPQDTNICWDCAPVKTNLRLQLLGTNGREREALEHGADHGSG